MPLTKGEAQGVTRTFIRDYPGAIELAYRFRDTVAELYGSRTDEVPPGMKGGYISQETLHASGMYRGRVEVPLVNMNDARDLLLTLRHEVLGHYGINTFTPGEKRALLDSLIAARNEPSLKLQWAAIDKRYVDSSLDMRAEEVYAEYCEGIELNHHLNINQVLLRGQQSYRETCLAPVRLLSTDDLQNITCMVAQGLRDRTRTQQNFPTLNKQFRKKETDMETKKPFHEIVAEKLIEKLKEGTAPWQKPWQPGASGTGMPINLTTGNRYKGVNAIHLMNQGYTDQRWMTYKQATSLDAQVRKGERGSPIQYWKFREERNQLDDRGKPVLDANGEPVKHFFILERPKVFSATVFNAEQIDGLPTIPPRPRHDWNPLERAERILQLSGAIIHHNDQNRACYRVTTDSIHLPKKDQFPTADNYYATALHELGHWTGHESRLGRDLIHPFGSEGYAKEELRAEIASMILGNELDIGHDPGQHVAYVESWIKVLQENPLEIYRATADAEKIQDFVLGLEQKQIQVQGNVTATEKANMPEPTQVAPSLTHSQKPSMERQYLAVPYGEHIAAKAAGAKWDKVAKSWYIDSKADMAKLERWASDKTPNQQVSAMPPEEEFADMLKNLGCLLDVNSNVRHPIMDGKTHRIAVAGDKKGEQAGFYIGHLDGHPAGYIKNNKTGIDMKWKSKGYVLDPKQKAQMHSQTATQLQTREVEQGRLQEQIAQRVAQKMFDLLPVTQPTAYMQSKGILPQTGVMTDKEGQKTYIPAIDVNGKQWTVQYIQEDGTKRFAKDGRKEGCFHVVGGLDALVKVPALVIGEGYATASSLSQTLGFATVAAFDSGNLVHVAKALREKFPDKPIIIAGDDDKHLEATQGVNPGRSKAGDAAKAVGGKVLLPVFAPGESTYPKELTPVTPQAYREHLIATKTLEDAQAGQSPVILTEQQKAGLTSTQLNDHQLAALARMKQYTDFNDLSIKSALGKEGVKRQFNSILNAVIEKHQIQAKQPQEHVQKERPPRTVKIT